MTSEQQRILLVEDEPDVAEMVRFFLQEHGYIVLHARDGAEALTIAQQAHPHLILMDSILPDMDGTEITARLRQMPVTAFIPVIFLTRRAERSDRVKALELGAEDFIAKPFDPRELLLRVRNSLHHAVRTQRISPTTDAGYAMTRQRLAEARQDPTLAIITLRLEHSSAYAEVYGEQALHEVHSYLNRLVLWVLNQSLNTTDFAGYIDPTELLIIYPAGDADALVERITTLFNDHIASFYPAPEPPRRWRKNGQRAPLMQLDCRIHSGDDSPAVV